MKTERVVLVFFANRSSGLQTSWPRTCPVSLGLNIRTMSHRSHRHHTRNSLSFQFRLFSLNLLIPFDIVAFLHQRHKSNFFLTCVFIQTGESDDASFSGIVSTMCLRENLHEIFFRSVHPEHFDDDSKKKKKKRSLKRQSIHAKMSVCVWMVVEAGHSSLLIFRGSHAST